MKQKIFICKNSSFEISCGEVLMSLVGVLINSAANFILSVMAVKLVVKSTTQYATNLASKPKPSNKMNHNFKSINILRRELFKVYDKYISRFIVVLVSLLLFYSKYREKKSNIISKNDFFVVMQWVYWKLVLKETK